MKDANDILDMPIDTLLAAFFNAEEKDGNFVIVSNYRATRYLAMIPESYKNTAMQLSKKYGLLFKQVGNTKIEATITNHNNYSLEDFRHLLYENILQKFFMMNAGTNIDKEIALALFIFRGSADFIYGFYSVDLKTPSLQFLNDTYKILLSSNDLINRLNLNFREFQPQYTQGIQRNTQVRINLKWFYDNVIVNYPEINNYKYAVLRCNYNKLGDTRRYNAFVERLTIYREDVIGRKLSESEKNKLRDDLNFEISNNDGEHIIGRNQKIVSFAREAFPDKCVGCCDHYNIADRSFIMPRNGRYYFEINHVIPYANDNKRVDVLDNLVKLCPTCHRALTPGRADESLQREIIHNMIESRPEVKQFVIAMESGLFATPEDYVFSVLR